MSSQWKGTEEEGQCRMAVPADPCQECSGKGKPFSLSHSQAGCHHWSQSEKPSSGGKHLRSLRWGCDEHRPAALLAKQPQNQGLYISLLTRQTSSLLRRDYSRPDTRSMVIEHLGERPDRQNWMDKCCMLHAPRLCSLPACPPLPACGAAVPGAASCWPQLPV